MDYRKLISFGKSSFVISLPKPWLVKNDLKKGCVIYINEEGNDLKLSPNTESDDSEEKEITIDVTDKQERDIRREIVTSYIGDYKSVVIVGKDLQTKAVYINNMLQELMAMEIMEQTSTKIIARDFLDIKNISIPNIVRKMDIITRAMITDSKQIFEPEMEQNIRHRDSDVNRMKYLVLKVLRRALKSSSVAKTIKMHPLQIHNTMWIANCIEMIADQSKRIASVLSKIKPNAVLKKDIANLYSSIEAFYVDSIKAYYEGSAEKAFDAATLRSDLNQKCGQFHRKHEKNVELCKVSEKFLTMISSINEIGRVVYTP